MHPPKPKLALVALAAAIVLSGPPAVQAQGGPPGGKPPPTPVEAVKPQVDTVVEQATTVGTLRAAEAIIVRPEIAGRIEKVHFEEGQAVKAGAPLFTLDASLVRAEVNEWDASVAQSRRETNRAKELAERKLMAQSDLDTRRAQLAIDEARLSSARTRLGKTVIRAPFDGAVGLRQVSPGEYVEVGQALVTFGQSDPIKLDFRVPETQLARVAVGQTVRVEVDAYPGQSFAGEVYALDTALDADGRSLEMRAQIPNPERKLRPGLFARVNLELASRPGALLVPEQALWPQGDKQFVYTIDNGSAKLVEVQTGVRRNGLVEIRSGLTPETLVITAGQMKIGPGMPVQAIAQKAAAPAPAPAPK